MTPEVTRIPLRRFDDDRGWFMELRPWRFTTDTLHFFDSSTIKPFPGVPSG